MIRKQMIQTRNLRILCLADNEVSSKLEVVTKKGFAIIRRIAE
jgi:hypothetical protein